jgi:DNA repair protein RadC
MNDKKNHLNIKSWSEADRPREKLLLKGVASLSDAELIAILIGSGSREVSAVDLSRIILKDTGNDLSILGKRTVAELMKYKGIGEAKAITIISCMELGRRRRLHDPASIKSINSSKDAYNLIGPQLMDLSHEEFWILLLNKGMRLIKKVHIGIGGVGGVVVDKAIIFKHAIEHLASSIILVHNHPSGRLVPSKEDDQITSELVQGARLLGLRISDHIIIGGDNYFSYLDEGKL